MSYEHRNQGQHPGGFGKVQCEQETGFDRCWHKGNRNNRRLYEHKVLPQDIPDRNDIFLSIDKNVIKRYYKYTPLGYMEEYYEESRQAFR